MTYKEAYDIILGRKNSGEDLLSYIKDTGNKRAVESFTEEVEADKIALDVLAEYIIKKKGAVKPKYYKGKWYEGYVCSECDLTITLIERKDNDILYETPKYCKWCGVKLDWSDK